MNYSNENNIDSDFSFLSDDIDFSGDQNKHHEISQSENNKNKKNIDRTNISQQGKLNVEGSSLPEDTSSSFSEDVELLNVEDSNTPEDTPSSFSEDVDLLNVEDSNTPEDTPSSFSEDGEM